MNATLRFSLLSLLLVFAAVTWGQDYPRRSVRVVAPFAPGGATDVLARLVSQKLAERWGQNALVDNRVGAGGHIGADYAAKSAPVNRFATFLSAIAVHPSLPVKTVKELIVLAGQVQLASIGLPPAMPFVKAGQAACACRDGRDARLNP